MVFFLMATKFDLVTVEGDTITGGDLYAVSLLASSLIYSWQSNIFYIVTV